MKKKYLVSIIIVNYNTFELTKKCVDSIYKFEKNLNFEIILIDNGSIDGSVEKFEKLKSKYNNFAFVSTGKNLGFSKGNNLGIKIAKGKYIFLLNSDAEIISSDTLLKLIDFSKHKENIGAVVPKLLNSDKSEQGSILYLPTLSRAFQEFVLKRKKYFGLYVPQTNQPQKVEAAVMAAFLITPIGISKVKKLDDRYFLYFEDLQYCRDLKNKGLDIYYLPNVSVLHHHGASGKNLAENKNQWKRQIPSSKIYHGIVNHYLIFLLMFISQKFFKSK